jgi:lipid II:glycine glycyltransferase (peptidoglycan interpeptide bridge formation enzyme)
VKSLLRKARNDEVTKWDELVAKNPAGGEVFQAKAFAKIKDRQGWQTEFWVYETTFGKVYTLALSRRIYGLGKIIYIPRGPNVASVSQWREICKLNRKFLSDAIFVKMEPPILQTETKTLPDDLTHVENIQGSVANTIVINLDKDEDDLWHSLRQRARRSIRGGKKEKLQIREVDFSRESAAEMWKLYKETVQRAKVKTRGRNYFYKFWREYSVADNGRFFFVTSFNGGEPIAGAFVHWSGRNALYKDGGSRRDSQAHFSHLLHWQIMNSLHEKGIKFYDLGGTPPSDKLDDKTHRLASLVTFKLSFGAPVADYVGAYDQILKPKEYKKWRKLEKLWRSAARRTPFRDIY